MNVQELKDKKNQLEIDITDEINRLLVRFHVDTKFSPEYISIDLVDATAIGEANRKFIVGKVRADIKI